MRLHYSAIADDWPASSAPIVMIAPLYERELQVSSAMAYHLAFSFDEPTIGGGVRPSDFSSLELDMHELADPIVLSRSYS